MGVLNRIRKIFKLHKKSGTIDSNPNYTNTLVRSIHPIKAPTGASVIEPLSRSEINRRLKLARNKTNRTIFEFYRKRPKRESVGAELKEDLL